MDDFCSLTISDYLHPYKIFDYNTNHIFDVHKKYIENNELSQNSIKNLYDFEILDNQIFFGNKNNCVYVVIKNNIAKIKFFGFFTNHSKKIKNLFLWTLFFIMNNFENINLIELTDDIKMDCNNKKKYLAKYYFLKYGEQYYELYFNFTPFFNNNKHKIRYKENRLKRYTLNIDIEQLKNTYKDNNYNDKIMYNKFKKIFGENKKISLIKFFKKIPKSLQYKYCDFFFDLIDDIFDENFYNSIGQTFHYKIDNKNKFINYIKNKIDEL
jgi:hypothetical protein